jgi:hypothetical protein
MSNKGVGAEVRCSCPFWELKNALQEDHHSVNANKNISAAKNDYCPLVFTSTTHIAHPSMLIVTFDKLDL